MAKKRMTEKKKADIAIQLLARFADTCLDQCYETGVCPMCNVSLEGGKPHEQYCSWRLARALMVKFPLKKLMRVEDMIDALEGG